MPSHREHHKLDRLAFGREFPLVHRIKDAPYRILGKRHRIVGHDHLTNLFLGLVGAYKTGSAREGLNWFLSGELHDLADFGSTKLKRRARALRK